MNENKCVSSEEKSARYYHVLLIDTQFHLPNKGNWDDYPANFL